MDAPVLYPGVKRSHDGNPVHSELTPDSTEAHVMTADIRATQRGPSPALSTTSSSLTDITTQSGQSQPANHSGSPNKKRKLTFAEKEVEKAVQKAEKEERARIKVEEKARKEEEKRVKDEEKRRKAEEREAAKRAKDLEKAEKDAEKDEKKRAKEAEKAKLEAEKLKKERAQMRLGAFFGRPALASTLPSTLDDVSSGVSSRRSSIASIDVTVPALDTKPPSSQSEYSKWILPFFPHDHTKIAPHNRFVASGSSTPVCVDLPTQYPNAKSQPINQRFGPSRRRPRNIIPVKTLITLIGGSEHTPIDLTGESTLEEATVMLKKMPYKILSFREDIRPPYQGTYTRPVSPRSSRKLSRRPTARVLTDTDYDYNSEAEWQAPEADDEDLEDEDELSEDEEDVDEMADFLDDENDILKRRVAMADAEPVSTGLCWEGETDLKSLALNIAAYRMDMLDDDTKWPIDPYSTDHWSQSGKSTTLKAAKAADSTTTSSMQPPRVPLSTLNVPNGSPLRAFITTTKAENSCPQKENASPLPAKAKAQKANKPVKTIPEDMLPAFKSAIAGSDLTKIALVEILKKQFPSCPKDAIKGTLDVVAMRQGKKEVDKRWVLIA